ncbi:YycH family regulatory protein [Lacticaseibacillus hulanensis]|uniref:YycH family regulatory protein n=1 Tax=Lacticaseibacillus hulanensis TaxID=2493111 RepID=UPI0013E34D98|nr:two-component system activity regulator YycH [Lacticaseibacillus hulanensis]
MKAKDICLRVALIILVAISLIFTWIIWFNPAHLEHRATTDVAVKTTTHTTSQKNKDEVFLPVAVYQQKNGAKKLLVNNDTDMAVRVHKAMQSAQINRVGGSRALTVSAYDALLTQDNTVQLVYTDRMSWHLFNSLFFTKSAKNRGGEFEFTRIVIDMRHEKVDLVNDNNRTVRRLSFAKTPDYGKINRAINKASTSFTVVESRMNGREVALYPDGLAMQPFAYLVDQQGANHFVAALLGNKSTSAVDSKQVGDQTFYTVNNNNQRLIADRNDSQMQYENFATDGPKKTRKSVLSDAYTQMMQLQPTSVDGVRFTHYDTSAKAVTFRTYVDGLPVFNQTMSGTVEVTRTDGSLTIDFSGDNLSVPVPTRENPVKLASTSTVLANVRAKGFTNGQIDDVQPGYKWEKDDDSSLVIDLVPTYYVRLNGTYYDYASIMDGTITEATIKAKVSEVTPAGGRSKAMDSSAANTR